MEEFTFGLQGAQHIWFQQQLRQGRWEAAVTEKNGGFVRTRMLPVFCRGHGDVSEELLRLSRKPSKHAQQRIHLMRRKQSTAAAKEFVYLGELSLKGGTGSSENGRPSHEEAEGSTPSGPMVEHCKPKGLEKICNMEDLVKALNDEDRPDEDEEKLVDCAYASFEWFDGISGNKSAWKDGTHLHDFGQLALIKPNSEKKKKLLIDFLTIFWGKCIDQNFGYKTMNDAILFSLQNMDKHLLKEKYADLMTLGMKLLAKLKTDGTRFTKASFSVHLSTLNALHWVLLLIGQVDSKKWSLRGDEDLYAKFRKEFKSVAKAAHYYPVQYCILILEQALVRLISGERSWKIIRERVGHLGKAGTDFYEFACRLATYTPAIICIPMLYFATDKAISGCKNLKKTFSRLKTDAKPWYDLTIDLNREYLLWKKEEGDQKLFDNFTAKLEEARKQEESKQNEEDQTALRFSIVKHLYLSALDGPTVHTRELRMSDLLSFAEKCQDSAEILVEILESLINIAEHFEVEEQATRETQLELTRIALEIVEDTPTDADFAKFSNTKYFIKYFLSFQKAAMEAIGAWKMHKGLKKKVGNSFSIMRDDSEELSGIIKKHLGGDTAANSAAHTARLEKHYKNDIFARMPSFLEDLNPKHVKEMKCQLNVLKNNTEDSSPSSKKKHFIAPEGHKSPIELKDIFNKKGMTAGQESGVRSVLVVGQAGTGKTALSHRLAYMWATHTWGQNAIGVLYVLPLRTLQKSKYGSSNFRNIQNLATAIANEYFASLDDNEYEAVKKQIHRELSKPSTLVVLDGLDERHRDCEDIVNEAKRGSHKLLMLSRPYGIEQERGWTDVLIEISGFNDQQMQEYIEKELGSGDIAAASLLSFIRKQPAMVAVAHVPVNLEILCSLWKDKKGINIVQQEVGNGSLAGLYRTFADYLWRRCMEKYTKYQDGDSKNLFDALGEISKEALENRDVAISRLTVDTVVHNRRQTCLQEMLKDAGFLLSRNEGNLYEFPHLTFQEYFVGRTLAEQLCSHEKSEQMKAGDFIVKHKYKQRYRMTLMFLAGEISRIGGGIGRFLTLVDMKPREVIGSQHLLLQLQVLHEWLCVGGDKSDSESESIKDQWQKAIKSLMDWLERMKKQEQSESLPDASRIWDYLCDTLETLPVIVYKVSGILELFFGLSQDTNNQIYAKSIRTLGFLGKVCPAETQMLILEHLTTAAFKHRNLNIRRIAFDAVGVLLKEFPHNNTPVILERLVEAFRCEAESARPVVMRFAGTFFGQCSESEAPTELKHLIDAVESDRADIHKYGVDTVRWFLKDCPHLAPIMLRCLINALKKSMMNTGCSFGELTKECPPAQAPVLIDELIDAVSDERWETLREVAMSLGVLVKACPDKAPIVLEQLTNACRHENPTVRSKAIESLGVLPGVCSDTRQRVFKCLMHAVNDEEWRVREQAMNSLGELVKTFRDKVLPKQKLVLKQLRKACKLEIPSVRSKAIESLGVLPGVCSDTMQPVFKCLMHAVNDEEWRVRDQAMKSLAVLVKACPVVVPTISEQLANLCKNKNADVREKTMHLLEVWTSINPDEVETVFVHLKQAIQDQEWRVQAAAVHMVGVLAPSFPVQAADSFDLLISTYYSIHPEARVKAIASLRVLVNLCPGKGQTLFETLVAECNCNNSSAIRWEGAKSLGELIKIYPSQAPNVLTTLITAFKDKDIYVRIEAIKAVGVLVEGCSRIEAPRILSQFIDAFKTEPGSPHARTVDSAGKSGKYYHQSEALRGLECLVDALKDRHWFYRKKIIRSLGMLLKPCPILAQTIVELLIDACRDKKGEFRPRCAELLCDLARECRSQAPIILTNIIGGKNKMEIWNGLANISVDLLIDAYWEEQNEDFIPYIVPKLHHTALIADENFFTPGELHLILFLAGKTIKMCSRSTDKVQHFIGLLRSSRPDLSKHTKSANA